MAPQGPSQSLTALLTRLPDATNRTLIDQAAVDFAFLNSKAARKRLAKVSSVSVATPDHFLTPFGTPVLYANPEKSERCLALLF